MVDLNLSQLPSTATQEDVYRYLFAKYFPQLQAERAAAMGALPPDVTASGIPAEAAPPVPVQSPVPEAPPVPIETPPLMSDNLQNPNPQATEMGYTMASIGQNLGEAGRMMSTTPGHILLGYQPAPVSPYIQQYIQKQQMLRQLAEEKRANLNTRRQEIESINQIKLAESQEKRAQEDQTFQRENQGFVREQRAQMRSQWAIDETNLKEAQDPNSLTSRGQRAAVEAIYPGIRNILPTFNDMSATEIQKSMPPTLLKAIQDNEEAKLRIEAQSEARKQIHEERMMTQEAKETEASRKRGMLPEPVAKEFRNLAKINSRIDRIDELWKEVQEKGSSSWSGTGNTGPIFGRVSKALARVGTEEMTAELQSEIGKAFADYVKEISGAAVSEQEFQRLALNLPSIKDSKERFAHMMNSWRNEQVNTLSALVESEVNREPGNRFLKENAQAQLKSINSSKTLVEINGAWRVVDDKEHPKIVAEQKAKEQEEAATIEANKTLDKVPLKQAGDSKVYQIVILDDNLPSGQKVSSVDAAKANQTLRALQVKGGNISYSGEYIIVDFRKKPFLSVEQQAQPKQTQSTRDPWWATKMPRR